MFKSIKESFSITNKYIILATPLILFSFLSTLYMLISSNGNRFSLLFTIILFCLMLGAFLSGWLFMTKECIINPDNEDFFGLIKKFPEGVGEYFLPALGLMFNSFIVTCIFFLAFYYIGMHFIGEVGFSRTQFANAMTSVPALKTFLTGLTTEQLMKLNAWNILIMLGMSITSFVLMFYSPVLFFKTKNPFKALFISFKDLICRNIFKNAGLFIIISVSYFVLSVLTTFAGLNVITQFIFTMINFYYTVLIVVLIFEYYYSNYIKIGSKIDTTV